MKTLKKSSEKVTLEDRLESANNAAKVAQEQVEKIKSEIEKRNAKNKPKSIMDRVKTLADVLKIAKPTKEELALVNYKGKSKRMLFSKHMLILSLTHLSTL